MVLDRVLSKTTSNPVLGKQVSEIEDYNVAASLEITSQFTDGPQVEAAMAHLLAVVAGRTLLDLALDEAAARDREMDSKRSKNERYRKEGSGYDHIRGQELEVQLAVATYIEYWRREAEGRVPHGLHSGRYKQVRHSGSSDKPDYTLRTSDTGALSWSLVALVIELKYLLAELHNECLGETTSRLDELKSAQPNRKYAYAVLVCSREIQVQKLDMADFRNEYSFS